MPSIVIQKGDPEFTKKTAIVSIVDRWKALHPAEWQVFIDGQKAARAGLYNESGIDRTGNVASEARVPEKILDMIDVILEGSGARLEQDDKLWKWFLESFPVFRIAKKTYKRLL